MEFYILYLGFVFLAMLGLFAKIQWWIKVSIFSFALLSCFFVFNMIELRKGSPREEHIPSKVVVFGTLIREPLCIYLWAEDPVVGDPPICYKLPYKRSLHESLHKAKENFKGKPFLADIKGGKENGKSDLEGHKEAKNSGQAIVKIKSVTNIDISTIPNPKLPPKE